ncbi:MAG: hypothetical protein M1326_00130, partial [Cyanobacteria bacterium]|nr:hypothetical protein [Cyanobacteriota bacterium]
IKKEYAIFFATNPLIIIEGLVNSHNDLISVTIAIVGIYLLFKSKKVISRVLLILSAGIKYSTFPLFFLGKNKFINLLILLITLISIIYISYKLEIQPWYFIVLFAFLPFFEKFIYKLNIFFAGLLLSYYSYIRLGGWGKIENIYLKHQIIIASFILNLLFIAFYSKIRSLLKYGAK